MRLWGRQGLGLDAHAARHAQVPKDHRLVVQVPLHVFGAAVDAQDGAALHTLGKVSRHRLTEIAASYLDEAQDAARHAAVQSTANSFDFGKLGHGNRLFVGKRKRQG